ncbi:MAG: hypothetical protein KF891_05820 [Rhizobacter sp.]|nr:hypothetical protein [Rhizobacter sp.]
MLALIPKSIPSLLLMLDDIGCSPAGAGSVRRARALAKALGVGERTVRNWIEQGYAPRPAMLAIFWITRWGQSTVNTKAENDARLYAGYVNCLKAELEELRGQLRKLGELGDFGSANDPAPGVSGPGPTAPALVFPPIRFPEDTTPPPAVEPQATAETPRLSKRKLRSSLRG